MVLMPLLLSDRSGCSGTLSGGVSVRDFRLPGLSISVCIFDQNDPTIALMLLICQDADST
jgi:hypothetical protein